MTDEDYRLKYRIPVGNPLVCLEWSDNQSRHNIERDAKETLTARAGPGVCPTRVGPEDSPRGLRQTGEDGDRSRIRDR